MQPPEQQPDADWQASRAVYSAPMFVTDTISAIQSRLANWGVRMGALTPGERRVLLAIGSAHGAYDESDRDVNEPLIELESYLTALPPGTRLEARVALQYLRWRSGGSADAAARHWERLAESRYETARAVADALRALALIHAYAQPTAWPAIGYEGPPSFEVRS